MPLTIGILAAGPYLNGIGCNRTASAVPVNPQTDVGIIEIELKISCVLDRVERERILASCRAYTAFLPKIESEIPGAAIPIVARRDRSEERRVGKEGRSR